MSKQLTQSDYQMLQQELTDLQLSNQEIVQKMHDMSARDLSSSSTDAFFQLNREQDRTAQRIEFINEQLTDATIVDNNHNLETVSVGNRIEVYDFQSEDNIIFEIVGTILSEPGVSRVTSDSPLGRAFLGLKRGQEVEVETPAGVDKYRIVDIMPIPEGA